MDKHVNSTAVQHKKRYPIIIEIIIVLLFIIILLSPYTTIVATNILEINIYTFTDKQTFTTTFIYLVYR